MRNEVIETKRQHENRMAEEEAEEIVAILSEARQRRRLKPSCQVFKS